MKPIPAKYAERLARTEVICTHDDRGFGYPTGSIDIIEYEDVVYLTGLFDLDAPDEYETYLVIERPADPQAATDKIDTLPYGEAQSLLHYWPGECGNVDQLRRFAQLTGLIEKGQSKPEARLAGDSSPTPLGTHWSSRKPNLGVGKAPEEAAANLAQIPPDVIERVALKPHEFGWRFPKTADNDEVKLDAATIYRFDSLWAALAAGIPQSVIDAFGAAIFNKWDPGFDISNSTYGAVLAAWMLDETPRLFPEE